MFINVLYLLKENLLNLFLKICYGLCMCEGILYCRKNIY